MKEKVIYLDSHASTPVDQDVLNEMLPYFMEHFGNGNHKAGWKTASAMEGARNQVSNLIGGRPSEIIFTSGATEAINLALLGLADAGPMNRKHIVTQQTEHAAVLQCLNALRDKGFKITILEVDTVGRIDLNELQKVVDHNTLAVAIMLTNNEIGTVQPIEEIGRICRAADVKFFCDLTQGLGWHSIDVDKMNIDLAAMSAHKIYGPRGVGALFLRRQNSKTTINPILFGGGQELGIRPGTANIPAIVGFGKACEIYFSNAEKITRKVQMLRDRLQDHILNSIESAQVNGCISNRHPGNLNIAIPGITGEDLLGALPNIIFSSSSACASGSAKPSHVVSALGVNEEILKGVFRFGINKFNTTEEIDYVGQRIVSIAKHLLKKRGLYYELVLEY